MEEEIINGEKTGNYKNYCDDSELLCEEEYLNGKINDAKIYKKYGKLRFEVEYLNGERNGKGKEYNDKDELEFEGEYLDGKRWNGKGKEYHNNGKLKFEGEYLNGEKNGTFFEEY